MRVAIPLTVLGAIVLGAGLGLHPMGRDEAVSVLVVRHSPVQVVSMLAAHEVHPAGYFLLLWAWPHATAVEARSLGWLAAVACVPLSYVAGERLGLRRPWVLGLLAAVSPFFAYEAQEARMYAFLALYGAIALLVVAVLPERPGWRWAVGLGALFAAGAYFQYFSAFTSAGVLALLLLRRSHRVALGAVAVAAVLFLPGLWMLYLQLPVFLRYPQNAWQEAMNAQGFRNLAGLLFAGAEYDPYGRNAAVVLAIPALVGAVLAPRRVKLLLLAGGGVPLLLSFTSSTFSPRYLAASVPVLLYCLALAIERLPGRVAVAGAASAAAVSLLFTAYGDVRYNTLDPPTPELLAAARQFGAEYVVGHVLFATQAAFYAPGQEAFVYVQPRVDHIGLWSMPPGLPYPPGLADPARADQPVLVVDFCDSVPPIPDGYQVERRWVNSGADFCAWLADPPGVIPELRTY